MKTKPFDLQKALAGHPVVAKNGKRVTQIAHFPMAGLEMFRLQVLLEGEGYPLSYSEDGSKYADSDTFGYNLLLEVKTEKRWARIIRRNSGEFEICSGYFTKQDAEIGSDWFGYEVLPAYEYEIEL